MRNDGWDKVDQVGGSVKGYFEIWMYHDLIQFVNYDKC